MWWDNRFIVRRVRALNAAPPLRVWLSTGTAEGEGVVAGARRVRDALIAKGWTVGESLHYQEIEGARAHRERVGRDRARDAAVPLSREPLMHREHRRWQSPSLGKEMDLLIFGHAGARMLVFPTSMGRFFEWEDRGMMHALGEHLENGWLQLYCVDSVDAESWYAKHKHPADRARATRGVRALSAARGAAAVDAHEPESVPDHRRARASARTTR